MRRLNLLLNQLKSKEISVFYVNINNVDRLNHILELVSEFNELDTSLTKLNIDKITNFNNNTAMMFQLNIKDKIIWNTVTSFTKMTEKENCYDDKFVLTRLKQLSEILCEPSENDKKVNEVSEPECEQLNNQEGKTMLKVFHKGKVAIEQLIYQMFIQGKQDVRPFVKKLVDDEFSRINNTIKSSLEFPTLENCYNIKLISSYENLLEFKDKNVEMSIETAIEFYIYSKEMKKELNPKTKVDYSWIKDYLTHENINNENGVVLFDSKKIQISIQKGNIVLVTKKTGMQQYVEIKYNQESNSFYL